MLVVLSASECEVDRVDGVQGDTPVQVAVDLGGG
jgi:hypothetical protein